MANVIQKSIRKMSIRKTLLLSYVSMILVIVVVSSMFFYYNYVNLTIDQTNRYTFSALNELNKRINSMITELVNLSFYLQNNDDIKYYVKRFPNEDSLGQLDAESKIMDIANSYFGLSREIANINVFIANKKYGGVGHNSVYPLEKVQDTEWFKKLEGVDQILLETQLIDIYMTPYQDGVTQNCLNTITTLSRIKDSEGKDIGYLNIDLSEDYIYRQLLHTSKVSSGSEIFIINNRGIVISANDKKIIGKKISLAEKYRIYDSSKGGFIRIKYNGKDTLMEYTDANKQGWRIVELIPTSELYMGFQNVLNMTLVFAIILIILAIPISAYYSKNITKPIIILASIMKKLRTSNIKEKVESDYSNEIGELYSSYNAMLARIDELISDIKQSEELRRQSDIKALQAQINPHFLYNTLNSISWNAVRRNVPEISEMISKLSMLFRLGLNKGLSICSVGDEVEHVKHYMDIQKLCHLDCFEYSVDMDPGEEKLIIPKLILQPLVENSIIHGFDKMTAGGRIWLGVYRDADLLYLEVADNGKGMSEENIGDILSKDSKRKGYGIKNVNERIKYICGPEYGIKYSIKENGGISAKVVLPVITEEDRFRNL